MELEILDIHKAFGKRIVLEGISISASSGTCIGILGRNGCGKSTLLSIIAGITRADRGQVLWQGKDISKKRTLGSKIVGYVPQGTPLMDELTALDNLRLWYDKIELVRSLESGVLAELGIGEFLKTPVNKMSGGMKKRLSIGCSVANDPPVLLLDEPTAALDMPCRSTIYSYLEGCKKTGKILILTTHTPEEFALCDKLYVLKDGTLKECNMNASTEEIAKLL